MGKHKKYSCTKCKREYRQEGVCKKCGGPVKRRVEFAVSTYSVDGRKS